MRRGEIVSRLEGHILDGDWPPGMRIPLREAFLEEYGCSASTLQAAVTELMARGFLESRGSRGTFVVEHPPHLKRIALVFCHALTANKSQYTRACESQAEVCNQGQSGVRLACYHPVRPDGDGTELERLLTDLKTHRLAGLIFINWPPPTWQETPILQAPLPRVLICGMARSRELMPVRVDVKALLARALADVVARGREAPVVLHHGDSTPALRSEFQAQAERVGLQLSPKQCFGCHIDVPALTCDLVQLLLAQSRRRRPDSLIVLDDNLVIPALEGVEAAGFAAGRDLDVVGQCVFPWAPCRAEGVEWLGFDLPGIFRAAVRLVEAARSNVPLPRIPSFKPIDEAAYGRLAKRRR